mmetsp:Transcript_11554/g.11527  ORF Transcript_11554/g.11527 Transcript_11554/m.11527 type:complete len:128 (-) Transcript_11554:136-519(-)
MTDCLTSFQALDVDSNGFIGGDDVDDWQLLIALFMSLGCDETKESISEKYLLIYGGNQNLDPMKPMLTQQEFLKIMDQIVEGKDPVDGIISEIEELYDGGGEESNIEPTGKITKDQMLDFMAKYSYL